MINPAPQAAGDHREVSADLLDPTAVGATGTQVSQYERLDTNDTVMEASADFDWREWSSRHRDIRLHPAILIVLVNLSVVALGLTTSLGLVALPAEQPFEVTTTHPATMTVHPTARPAQPPAKPVPATPTHGDTPPPAVPARELVMQSHGSPPKAAGPPAAPKGLEHNGYALQCGAFANPSGAVRLQTYLQRWGYPAVLVVASEGGKTLRLVRIGGFQDRDAAVQTADALQDKAGLSSIIMQVQRR